MCQNKSDELKCIRFKLVILLQFYVRKIYNRIKLLHEDGTEYGVSKR